jgi:hypothetical protein
MSTKIIGALSGVEADVDTGRSLYVNVEPDPIGAAGGWYTVTGSCSAVVAATLAANTPLMTMRLAVGSARKVYIDRIRTQINIATPGVAGAISGTLGIQRFTTATPTGGTARTPCRLNEALGTTSDVTDVRDSNAALTVTSVVFGTVAGSCLIPVCEILTSYGFMNAFEWVFDPPRPVVLAAGDGISLRTQVACPATQTWVYSYTVHWLEK